MAKLSKTTFVCQNCGAASPALGRQVPLVRGVEHAHRGGGRHRTAGLGAQRAAAAAASSCSKVSRGARGGAALLDRDRRARPRHRRRHRAGLGAAHRRRAGHRQIDAAAAARRDAGPRGTPRRLLLRRGSGGAGASARRTTRTIDAPVALACETNLATSSRRSRPDLRPISSSSIPSRRCGPRRSRRRPAPSARCAPRRRR